MVITAFRTVLVAAKRRPQLVCAGYTWKLPEAALPQAAFGRLEPPLGLLFFRLDARRSFRVGGGTTNDCPQPAHRTRCPRIWLGIESVTRHLGFGHRSFTEHINRPS